MRSTQASERPRLVVADDGSQVAVAEGAGIGVFELPGRRRAAEINIAPGAHSFDLGWLGPRLAVLTRFEAHTTIHLVDPGGPRTLSEIQLESPRRLFTTTGSYALVAGGSEGIAILSATDTHVTPYRFPARSIPTAACATSASRFMVAVPGAIEEWDPQSRIPTRRLRLPRPATVTALGFTERAVWLTSMQDPSRIDVILLVNRGQPKAHDLPEPIAIAVGHPRSDIVVCLGAETGKLFVIDLDGRTPQRVIAAGGLDRVDAVALVPSRSSRMLPAVAIAQAGRPLALVSLATESREAEASSPIPLFWSVSKPERPMIVEDARPEPELPTDSLDAISTRANIAAPWGTRTPTSLGESPLGFAGSEEPDVPPEPGWQSSLVEPAPTAAARAFPSSRPPRPDVHTVAAPVAEPAPARAGQDLSRRFSAWRERLKESGPTTAPVSTPATTMNEPEPSSASPSGASANVAVPPSNEPPWGAARASSLNESPAGAAPASSAAPNVAKMPSLNESPAGAAPASSASANAAKVPPSNEPPAGAAPASSASANVAKVPPSNEPLLGAAPASSASANAAKVPPSNEPPAGAAPASSASANAASSNVASSNVASPNVASSNVASSNVASSNVASSNVASSNVSPSNVVSANASLSDVSTSHGSASHVSPSNPSGTGASNAAPSTSSPPSASSSSAAASGEPVTPSLTLSSVVSPAPSLSGASAGAGAAISSIGIPWGTAPPIETEDSWLSLGASAMTVAPTAPATVTPILPLPLAPVAAPPPPAIMIERAPTWRDELVAWRHARGPVPEVPTFEPIELLAQRFELSHDQVVAVALLYAAHLSGEAGVAPVDVARIVGWDDALGRGELAQARITTLDGSRLRLQEPIARVLDERAPRAGVVVGAPGPSTLLGPCAMLSSDESPLAMAERARAAIGGGILVATRELDIETLFLEARARGLVPLVPLRALGGVVRPAPCVIVVDDPGVLDELDVPRL